MITRRDYIAMSVAAIVVGSAFFGYDRWRRGNARQEPWDVRLYRGDAVKGELVAEGEPAVAPHDPKFGDLICLSSADFSTWIMQFRSYRALCPVADEVKP